MSTPDAAVRPVRPPALPSLTALRFPAALGVVIYHFGHRATASVPVLRDFIEAGYVGVSFFFVLSGFILAYNSAGTALSSPAARRAFWSARFARVYPAYLLALVLSLPSFAVATMGGGAKGYVSAALGGVSCLALLQAWIPSFVFVWNFTAWSLSVEAYLYFVFPFVLARLERASVAKLWAVLVGSWLAAIAGPGVLAALRIHGESGGVAETVWRFVKYAPVFHVPQFVIGVGAGLMFLKRRPGARASVVPVLVLAGAVLAVLHLSPALADVLLNNGLAAPLFAGMFFFSACRDVARARGLGVLELLGEASYSVYILQVPVYSFATHVMGRGQPSAGPFVLYCAALVAVSVVSFKKVETPLRLWIRARLAQGGNGGSSPLGP